MVCFFLCRYDPHRYILAASLFPALRILRFGCPAKYLLEDRTFQALTGLQNLELLSVDRRWENWHYRRLPTNKTDVAARLLEGTAMPCILSLILLIPSHPVSDNTCTGEGFKPSRGTLAQKYLRIHVIVPCSTSRKSALSWLQPRASRHSPRRCLSTTTSDRNYMKYAGAFDAVQTVCSTRIQSLKYTLCNTCTSKRRSLYSKENLAAMRPRYVRAHARHYL